MNKTTTTRYDVAEHLRTPEEMAAYLDACLQETDALFVAKALGDIARAKGMTQVARDAGLSLESLDKALSGKRAPDFDTVLKVVAALGLELHAEVVLPPSQTTYHAETKAAIHDLESGEGASFEGVDALMADLHEED